jgi:amino acid adenylation domain-containing protein
MSANLPQLDGLSMVEKRAMLARVMEERERQQKVQSKLYPLSFSQRRLWFLDQLTPGNPFYNTAIAVRTRAPLNPHVLERAINDIVRRHEALRTTFALVDEEPMQVVAPELKVPFRVVDLTSKPPAEREAEALRQAQAEAEQPFDLGRGPLLRSSLLRLGEADNIFLLTQHHIISDGWSMGIFSRELTALYTSFVLGQSSPLPELPLQYGDFAVWQRNWLKGEVLDRHLAYWKKQLADVPNLQLPTDRPRPPIQTYRGATHHFTMSMALATALKRLSQAENATLFMTLLTGFFALLHRYTQQEDIVVGTYIANRNRAEIESIIGFFVNTLVLRTDLSGAPTFRTLLRRVRDVVLSAYAHQDMPFETLVEQLQPERDLGRNPLFQVVFQVPPTAPESTNATAEALPQIKAAAAIFDLSVSVWETATGLTGQMEYSCDLFDASSIERLGTRLAMLLESFAADPEQPITNPTLLTRAERAQLVVDWNKTSRAWPMNPGLVQMFEAEAERNAQQIAFYHQEQEITYAELNARANRQAHFLRHGGVGPEVLVGLAMERSIDCVVSLLAILKAGGAYLPLDPKYPVSRLRYMLEDARVSVLVTKKQWLNLFGKFPQTRVICLEDAQEKLAQQSSENPGVEVAPEHLIYVMYTSGSTGQPKGVAATHRVVLNRLYWMWEAYPFQAKEVGAQKTALNFVDSVWELLGPLLKGFPCVVVPDATLTDPAALIECLGERAVTRLWLVPSLLKVLLESVPNLRARVPELKLWVSSGETLEPDLFARFQEILPEAVLCNLYGTTEIWDATWFDPRVETKVNGRVPIGRPISNVQVYVLDERGQPTPLGIPGELYVGGDGLARGYWHSPDLTAKKLVPNPFDARSGARLYRTGDRARFLPDGTLEYLGRLDNQVKIRGVRIELSEIEATLRAHPAIREAAVVARQTQRGELRLVAYVVQNPDYQGADEVNAEAGALNDEKLRQWQTVWNEAYRQGTPRFEATFNASGFNSSYTGLPIPAEEVQEWVENAVQRALSLKPRRVLEIGCGAGLLLWRIAPHCEEYWGSDFSAVAVASVQQQIERNSHEWPHVHLLNQPADNVTGISPEQVDLVILHSVAQYFPGIEYLLRVIEGAITRLCPRGAIYIGDVRSLPLLEAFHTSVELHQAPESLSVEALQERICRRRAQEQELVVDPLFFFALNRRWPRLRVEHLGPKRGQHLNEFTAFRYDVVLRLDSPQVSGSEDPETIWNAESSDPQSIPDRLQRDGLHRFRVRNVPNSRAAAFLEVSRRIQTGELTGLTNAGELRRFIQKLSTPGVDPERWWRLGKQTSYNVDLQWSGPTGGNSYDVCFFPQDSAAARIRGSGFPPERSWLSYANNPLQGLFRQKVVPHLREFLLGRLVEAAVPSDFVSMDALPLTPSGKLNRRALPEPDSVDRPENQPYVAPRTPLEGVLSKIWSELLGVGTVGVNDHFFAALRGHSLLAAQLISRIRNALGVDLPLRSLFEHPTVSGLAAEVERIKRRSGVSGPALVRRSREKYRLKTDNAVTQATVTPSPPAASPA